MTRTSCEDLCFQRSSGKGKIAHDVQQFVTCRFIIVPEFNIIENTFFLDFNFRLVQHLGDVLQFMRFNNPIHNHNGIIQITPFDQVVLIKHFQFMQKTECAARGKLLFELVDIRHGCVLASQHG
jgi:hypothetical protein